MGEVHQNYAFHPADLVDYAMDKPIGAARAALAIALEDTDVDADIVTSELLGNMELNNHTLTRISVALRKDRKKIISGMSTRVRGLQLERDIGL
ncbi:hypothetical protein ACCD10_27825 [Pseudomonas sp. Pseusp122]|uniref:hypothetical protein n=1 Tax=unclassified Pseudomonas TaxID=196821 RepID=UPI0039A565D4